MNMPNKPPPSLPPSPPPSPYIGQGTPPSKAQAERDVRENADTTRSFSKPSTVKVAQGVSGNMGSVMDFLLHSPVMSQHSLQDLGVRNVQGLPAGVNAGRVRFESRTGSAQVRAEPEGDARRTQRAPVGRITSPTTILFRAATRLTSLSQDSIRTSGQLCPIKRSRLRSTRAVTLTAQFSRVAAAVAASSRGTTALSTWSPASSNAGSFGPPVIPHNAPSGSYLFGMTPPRFNSYYRSTLSDNPFPTPANEGGDPGSSMLTRSCGCCRVLSWNYCPEHLVCTDLPHRSPEYMRRTRNVGLGTTLGKGSMYPSPGGSVKFRLSSQTRSGISVTQALNRERLSQLHGYKLPDFSPDTLNKITLRVRWSGYRSNTYSIPLSADYDGDVHMSGLALRTARAVKHFMQANDIRLPQDRVVIQGLRETETSPGIWYPVLVTLGSSIM